MSRAQLVDKTAQIPIMPPASRCSGACEGAGMGFSSSASHMSAAQAAGRDLCYSHLQPHIQRGKSSTPPSPPAPCPLSHLCGAITCLLEDILVSVLMLLVSVTTMAEGKREVWEYWGGSCLCAYTAERRGTAQGKATPSQQGQGWEWAAWRQGWDKTSQGKNPALPSKPLHSQAAAHPRKPVGTERLWLDQTDGVGEGRDGDGMGCDHPALLSIP